MNRKIELAVDWPAALPDGAKLNVWMTGTIARCEPDAVEVRVETYEFKTRRAPRSGSAPPLKRRLGARAMSGGAA
ncbi:MAG TPA: hypothetical protein VKT49_11375 [Bryobacteraceae bacterium]|nr:hypothetical protein [Bryobacteraceae bacterium]